MNIRQKELQDNLKAMVRLARDMAMSRAKEQGVTPRQAVIHKETFLAHYRIYVRRASPYATARYFNDFVTVGLFNEVKNKYNIPCFTVSWIADYLGVTFPTKEEWDGHGKNPESS